MVIVTLTFRCAKDYNPFESMTNVQVHLAPESCSQRIRDNDTLLIFTTETLSVYTTVREKIDSIKFHADNNRLQNDIVLHPPFSTDVNKFLVSFPDTGMHAISVTAFRSDNSISTIGPLTFHVASPLKQDSIFSAYGAPVSLSTPPVGDDDVYYWWTFGTATGDTMQSPFNHIDDPAPDNILPGKKGVGYLWISDTGLKNFSTVSSFSYEFYRAGAPVIKCTNKGLRSIDTVVSTDTMVFTVQVLDSSGVGLKLVEIAGSPVVTSDNLTYSFVFTGMKSYTAANPKPVTVRAVNNVNDSTVRTFYCFFEQTGPRPDLVRLTLVNPKSSLTTSQGSLNYAVTVNKYTPDTVNVRILLNKQIVKTQTVTDSVKTIFSGIVLTPGAGIDTITTQALIHGQNSADTSTFVTKNPNYVDRTPPEIVLIAINGKAYQPSANILYDLPKTDSTLVISVMTFDNESIIDSVNLTDRSKKLIPMPYNASSYSYVTSPIKFVATGAAPGRNMVFTLTVENRARLTTPQVTITIAKSTL